MHEEAEFRQYIGREIADTARSGEVIVGLSADSREQVDVLTAKVDEAGGRTLGPAQDQGFMYMRGFRDPDGHQWSFIYVDAAAMARPAG
jgi:predicted lactoylglutathione lyase